MRDVAHVATGIRKRSGVTLIELIVVLAIMGIVASGIWAVLQFSNRSFFHSDRQSTIQKDARYAATILKRHMGTAGEATILPVAPDPLPADSGVGYAYYNTVTRRLVMKNQAGQVFELLNQTDTTPALGDPTVVVDFTYMGPKLVRCRIRIDEFILETDIFLQNQREGQYLVTEATGVDADGNPNPGLYIRFS